MFRTVIRSAQAKPVDPGRDKADEMENNLIRQRPTCFPSHSGTYTLSSPSSLPTSLVCLGRRPDRSSTMNAPACTPSASSSTTLWATGQCDLVPFAYFNAHMPISQRY